MKLNYKCLILDHDDTAVKSTPTIHYPSFLQVCKELRPQDEPITLEAFTTYCYDPGFIGMCREILQFSESELEHQQRIWRQHTEMNIPDFYEGFPEIVRSFKELGGIITVVSLSERSRIERDYKQHCGFIPDSVFGWELPEHQRKPNPYPIEQILSRYSLRNTDVIMLDDLLPGLQMARQCEVTFAAAGWSHTIPQIKEAMARQSDYYFEQVQQFSDLIFSH